MGRASRRKRDRRPHGGHDEQKTPSRLSAVTVFTDVHPQHRINGRFFRPLFEMLVETTLSTDEQEDVLFRSLVLVANKLATTWKHLARYRGIETRLLEAARRTPLQRSEDASHDPELYRACDDFLVQLRDGLNRLWRYPADFFEDWPSGVLFDSIDAALASIGNMKDEGRAKLAQPIAEAFERQRPWIEDVLSQTAKGVDPRIFRVFVVTSPNSGEAREVIPMWATSDSVGAVMAALWERFYLLSELVVGAAIASRHRPEVTLMYEFQPFSSDKPSWVMMKPRPRLVLQPGDVGAVREALILRERDQPPLQATYQGQRFRVVGDQIIARPPTETFHEFLWGLLRTTLGEEWWEAERTLAELDRHQIIRWFDALVRWKEETAREENRIEGGWRAAPSGDVQALMAVAYDVYTLQHAMALPARLIARLRDHAEFQGAKYEIAVAAILRRAGFTLEFLEGSGRHCEFIARYPSGLRLGVEAKSRRRPGVLHEKGRLDELTAVKGDVQSLFDDAKQQKPAGLPFLIFIDLNAPLGSTVTPIDQPWLKDLDACLATHEATRGDRPDPFNAVIVTNFSTHYSGDAQIESKGVALLIKAPRPADSLPETVLHEVWVAVGRYGSPPEDLERFEEKELDLAGGQSSGE